MNRDVILADYKKRSIPLLVAEYSRLDTYIVDVLEVKKGCVDDDTEERYDCVKEMICEKLKERIDLTSGKAIDDFDYLLS